jgi:hypothetical protein
MEDGEIGRPKEHMEEKRNSAKFLVREPQGCLGEPDINGRLTLG